MVSRTLIVTILLASLAISACGTNRNPEIDALVSIGTHSLQIRCLGQGSPTVVIDTGVGDTMERWRNFQSQIAEFAHVCTYNRAGLPQVVPDA